MNHQQQKMPSFAIEAPAEANPLSKEALYRVVASASSNDPQQIQTGTKQLENWEKNPGFYRDLQSLYINHSNPPEVRYLAIIQLKNAVDKYWRRNSSYVLSASEKDLIRSRSLASVLDEPIPNLALQAAIFTAKVIRSDVGQSW